MLFTALVLGSAATVGARFRWISGENLWSAPESRHKSVTPGEENKVNRAILNDARCRTLEISRTGD